MTTISIIVCGVGGQGILTASDIIGQVALLGGFDVKKSEVHGMAQRGGSVVTAVRFGKKVYSPLISRGMADFILAFEKLEALRQLPQLKRDGSVIVNDLEIMPMPVLIGKAEYPVRIIESIRGFARNVDLINATKLAVEAGDIRTTNTVLLGALARRLDFDRDLWLDAIGIRFPKRLIKINRQAFDLGFNSVCR